VRRLRLLVTACVLAAALAGTPHGACAADPAAATSTGGHPGLSTAAAELRQAPAAAIQSAPTPSIQTAPPASPPLELHYEVYWSLLRLLTIASRSQVGDGVYNLWSEMEAVGMIGTLFPWTYRSEVHGRIGADALRPDTFSSHSELRDKVQQVVLRYDASGPLVDEVKAFDDNVLGEDYTRDEVPPEMRAGTIDPLTELASVSLQMARGKGCAGTKSVFDGLRRYDVVYEDLGETELESSSYDGYAGRARQCRSQIKPLAGFWKPKEEHGESLTSITAWMMAPLPGADPVPVRMEVTGARGTLTIHLVKAGAVAS
jgi:hypothetical protein